MKKIGIIINQNKDRDLHYTRKLSKSIIESGGIVYIDNKYKDHNFIKGVVLADEKQILENAEIIISLGGDGTLINVARKVYDYNKL